jgi:hypothetical protein
MTAPESISVGQRFVIVRNSSHGAMISVFDSPYGGKCVGGEVVTVARAAIETEGSRKWFYFDVPGKRPEGIYFEMVEPYVEPDPDTLVSFIGAVLLGGQ